VLDPKRIFVVIRCFEKGSSIHGDTVDPSPPGIFIGLRILN
jgi:hypothetical protein